MGKSGGALVAIHFGPTCPVLFDGSPPAGLLLVCQPTGHHYKTDGQSYRFSERDEVGNNPFSIICFVLRNLLFFLQWPARRFRRTRIVRSRGWLGRPWTTAARRFWFFQLDGQNDSSLLFSFDLSDTLRNFFVRASGCSTAPVHDQVIFSICPPHHGQPALCVPPGRSRRRVAFLPCVLP